MRRSADARRWSRRCASAVTRFGLLGLVWSELRDQFKDHEVALVEGIADQIGTALERDHLSAEVMRLKSALDERYGEDRIIGQARGFVAPWNWR